MAATFRVTQSQIIKTSAERRLPNTDSVLTMLKWVERHFSERLPRVDSVGNVSSDVQVSLGEMRVELRMPEENSNN